MLKSEQDEDLVPIFHTSDPSLLAVVESVLRAAEIPYAVQGQGSLEPLPMGAFGVGVFRPVIGGTVVVRRDHAEEARALLAPITD